MDQQEVQEWRNFCEGTASYEPNHFATLFMELYLEPLTEREKDDLRTILSFVPNSASTLEKMLRMDEPAPDKCDADIIGLVKDDLYAKRRIIRSEPLLSAIASSAITVMCDESRFQQACDSKLNREFFHELADYFTTAIAAHDGKIRALSNAFYGLASNVHLQWALTADLLGVGASFDNYFELYLIGVDYAVDSDGVVAMNYRAGITASTSS